MCQEPSTEITQRCSQPFPKDRPSSAQRHPLGHPSATGRNISTLAAPLSCPSLTPHTQGKCAFSSNEGPQHHLLPPSPIHYVPSLGQQHPCGKLYLSFTFRSNHPAVFSEDSQYSSCCLPYPPTGKAMLLPLRVAAGHPGTGETRWLTHQPSHTTEPRPTTSLAEHRPAPHSHPQSSPAPASRKLPSVVPILPCSGLPASTAGGYHVAGCSPQDRSSTVSFSVPCHPCPRPTTATLLHAWKPL